MIKKEAHGATRDLKPMAASVFFRMCHDILKIPPNLTAGRFKRLPGF